MFISQVSVLGLTPGTFGRFFRRVKLKVFYINSLSKGRLEKYFTLGHVSFVFFDGLVHLVESVELVDLDLSEERFALLGNGHSFPNGLLLKPVGKQKSFNVDVFRQKEDGVNATHLLLAKLAIRYNFAARGHSLDH